MDSWAVLPAGGFEVRGTKADSVVRFTCAAGEAVCAAMTRMRDGEEVGGPALNTPPLRSHPLAHRYQSMFQDVRESNRPCQVATAAEEKATAAQNGGPPAEAGWSVKQLKQAIAEADGSWVCRTWIVSTGFLLESLRVLMNIR
jgi:hypothetical protein